MESCGRAVSGAEVAAIASAEAGVASAGAGAGSEVGVSRGAARDSSGSTLFAARSRLVRGANPKSCHRVAGIDE
jgi:hypothetical protein